MKIKQKIAIAFLLIGVVPAFFVGMVNIFNMRSSLEASGKNKVNGVAGLEIIAKLKADRLESMFVDIKGQAKILQDSVAIKDNFPIIVKLADNSKNSKYIQAKNVIDNRLKSWVETQSWISDIVLTNSNGKIIYGFDPEHFGKELGGILPDMAVFEKGKKDVALGKIFMHMHKNNTSEYPSVLVAAPLKDDKGVFIGEIVLSVGMNPIYDLLQDLVGMGETGEVVVSEKIGEEVLILNPLRFDKDAALKRKIAIGSLIGVAAQKASTGENGSGYSIDYRGKESVSAWRYLPSLNWGLVVKIEEQEIFYELNNYRNLNILILITLAFISVAMALYFAKSISDPINNLAKAVNDISRGKLDVKLDKLEGKDEIADLSRAFERTVVSLKLAMKEMEKSKTQEAKEEETTKLETKKEDKFSESFKI